MRDHDDELPEDDGDDSPSRSQRRRDALAVFELAERLVALTDAQLGHLALDEDLLDEVEKARRITQQIARKRQIQFLAKIMRRREDELPAIRAQLDHDRQLARRETAELHRLEEWRDRLIDEGDEALTELLRQFPSADRQHLRQLARQARTERHDNRPPHAFRELFRELRALFEGGTPADDSDE
ncbi:MAG TPA: ribosome biogenesis factor YjgA [Tahibacter sp.]|uniref:ribosome biogenesis factor YjgA n=1 Tax=Tahibacter sp. TaxID=2056211 RepID=UPI002BDA3F2F|nr:ribosome biogenesis factor YjgA [Tahibacter sp.]HSX59875.1 ribosome biogenesis factor YjgA [Tahibacter sp.]